MKYRLEITDQASAELEFIFKWIESDSPLNAINWYNELVEVVESLAVFPSRCPVAPESEFVDQEIRCLLYGQYRILFTIEDTAVFVLHIRHGAQNFLR